MMGPKGDMAVENRKEAGYPLFVMSVLQKPEGAAGQIISKTYMERSVNRRRLHNGDMDQEHTAEDAS